MTWYAVLHPSDSNGNSLFKTMHIADGDIEKLTQWEFNHQKGREFVKNTFGDIHYEWDNDDSDGLLVPDFPSSGNPCGDFSQNAVDALSSLLIKYGDLHPLIMATGERYFTYDCWSFISALSIERARFSDGGHVKAIDIKEDLFLPEIFMVNRQPKLIVGENFKKAAEDAGLTGMVFAPILINRIKAE